LRRVHPKRVRAKAQTLEPDPVLKHHAVGGACLVLRIASVQDGNLADCPRHGRTASHDPCLGERGSLASRCFWLGALQALETQLRSLGAASIGERSSARGEPHLRKARARAKKSAARYLARKRLFA